MRSPLALALAAAATAALALPSMASASYTGAVLASSPLAYYPFNDPTPTADASGHGATLTTAGTPDFTVAGPFADAGKAVKLTSGDSLSSSVGASAGAPKTIEFWVNPSSRSAQTFVAYGDSSGGWSVGLAPTSVPGKSWAKRKLVVTVAGVPAYTRVALSTGTWTMVDAVLNTATNQVDVYLNGGATVKHVALTGAPAAESGQPVQIGSPSGKATTTLDEVALYPQALDAAAVKAHFGASPLPDATTPPTLSPLAGVKVGDTLHFVQGTYASGTGVTITDAWERCNDAVIDPTQACVDFDPATQYSAYTLQALDAGYSIQVKETATNAAGSIVTITDATDPVLAANGSTSNPGTNPPPPGDNGHPPVAESGPGGTTGGTTGGSTGGVSGVQNSCAARFGSVKALVARLGARKLRLSFTASTRTLKLSAPKRTVNAVTYRLDGKRLRVVKKAPFKAVVRLAGLRAGRHTLKATVKLHGGKTRTLTLRLTLKGC
jgi:hypothetical protein